MSNIHLHTASHLLTAFLFGGMLLFSSSFAVFLLKHLSSEDARMLIRKAFPAFYSLVIVTSGLVMLTALSNDAFTASWMGLIMLTTVFARQMLMPAINRASDSGRKKRFRWLHGLSVLLILGHIVLVALILVHMQS